MAKVSVIIPAYNAMAYLPETVNSVLQQTYKNFEIIIVDDGSSDNVKSWFETLKDTRMRLFSQVNQGLAAARNSGITESTGEYLAFLDGDDLWEASKLEKQVQLLDAHPTVGLVYTWVAYIDSAGKPTGRTFKHTDSGNVWKKLVEHNIIECGSVAMVRRNCLEDVGYFDSQLSAFNVNEDWDMWLRLAARYSFMPVPEVLVSYRQHANSASRNWEAMEQSFQIVIEKAFATAAPELMPLKQKSYGFANLCLAWRPLQSRAKDYQKADYFRQKALAYYPNIRFSQEFWRLNLAIALLRWFGPDRYQNLLVRFYSLRRRSTAIEK